ncbi:hypothetical protein SAMN02910340_02659 [Methanosarcina thermophila]|jgi:hypothetical protein|uniref:Uncharacterized protein n=3 Tax=Methanosarcina thermophila TaxID=2210 RepID=A0A1I7BAA7_METTE|nr:hypothetical protein [Methanosarcina thermophila]ALK05343.1 MAG: hypothetical protein AAY43_06070 [Methanosarcina sp. 795]AKB14134.1 hypothetical protein MSTHT_2376 [Methanosarcina thermophila TM-1]AKB15222.1 hypothetical protein MSTHC_0904 [Methanosarcina thermophila CHTI-55]NLU58258.1 hypothetical protein [Methanosarcina thermophila]SFT84031.1 hypothetical protein SAMN02910340_02659 [Methanosarcina thermophila]
MLWLMLAWLAGLIIGIFLLKVLLIKVAVQASLAYNAILGRNVQAKYQQVDTIPDWIKTLADDNIYQRYSINPPRIVAHPAFYRSGFKFFNGEDGKYAVSYDGTGKYTVYRRLKSEPSGNRVKSVVGRKSKAKV